MNKKVRLANGSVYELWDETNNVVIPFLESEELVQPTLEEFSEENLKLFEIISEDDEVIKTYENKVYDKSRHACDEFGRCCLTIFLKDVDMVAKRIVELEEMVAMQKEMLDVQEEAIVELASLIG